MRILIPNIITPETAQKLSSTAPNRSITIWDRPEVNAVAEKLFSKIPETPVLGKPSYWRVESNWDMGHKWHRDGCKEENGKFIPNHMAWCGYSASLLLTDPTTFSGGTFKFDDPPEEHREDHYLSAVFYSSGAQNEPQLHMVEPYSGNRTVLLMFFQVT